jgi:hypothetical protein
MMKAATLVGIISCAFIASRAPAQEVCVGDCNEDMMVAINELIIGVNIALGSTPLSECPSFDPNDDNMVGINELITAVNNALEGCPDGPPVGIERTFTLEPGMLLADPSSTGSGLFTTGLSGANAANSFSAGPLTLVLGAQDANGVAALTLKEDVVLTIEIVDGSHLCFKLLKENTTGSIDCNGGTAYDTSGTQPMGDVGFPFDIATGLGDPSGPGNGNLLVPSQYQIIQPGNPEFDLPCSEVTYSNPVQTFPFTTTTATSIKGDLELAVSGQPFSCETFGTSNSGGQLAAPAPATQAPVGDVANVFRFSEQPPQ